eukprot:g10508.t1
MDSWTVALRVARRVQEIEAHTSEVPNERPSQALVLPRTLPKERLELPETHASRSAFSRRRCALISEHLWLKPLEFVMLHVLIASWVVPSLGLSIVDAPWEARRSNILRVTGQPCDECSSMEDFYKDNELVFLLFYQRDLVSHHAYKGAIIAGFHEACKDLRWSRVACGIVDMLEDKAYAEKYIDPKTAPAHIAVRAGEPVPSKEEWIKKLLAKPGDKATELGSGWRKWRDSSLGALAGRASWRAVGLVTSVIAAPCSGVICLLFAVESVRSASGRDGASAFQIAASRGRCLVQI